MKKLCDVADFLSGGTPNKNKGEYWGGDIPWYSASNMKSRFLRDAMPRITEIGVREGSNIAPSGATLLLVRGSGLFKEIPICYADMDVAFNQDVKAIVAKPGVDPSFLHFWIVSLYKTLEENVDVTGIGAGKFNTDFLKSLPFPDTPIEEQRLISKYAEVWDRKIDLNRRMNETLEAMARAVFKSWFVDFDPVHAKAAGKAPAHMDAQTAALFPDAFGDDGLPVGWDWADLEGLFEINPKEKLQRGVDAPHIDMASVPTSGPSVAYANDRAFTSGSKFRNGDTLLARITPCLENGKTAFVDILPKGATGWGSTEFIVLRSRPPVPAVFSYLLARTETFRDHAIRSMTGTTGRQRVQVTSLSRFQLSMATEDVYRAFSDLISPWFERIRANENENQTLAALRDLLLPKLMSGELKLDANDLPGGAQ